MLKRVWRAIRTPIRASRDDEASNSFAIMVMALPVLVGAFGMAVDASRGVYARSSLQNALDTAVVSGTGVTTTSGGKIVIDPAKAIQTTRSMYAVDRLNGPATTCIGDRAHLSGTTLLRCWKEPHGAPKISIVTRGDGETREQLSWTVQEQMKNVFLPIVGVKHQSFTLSSQAVVNDSYDDK